MARDCRRDQFAQPLQVQRAHLGIEALGVLARERQQAEGIAIAQRQVRERPQVGAGVAEQSAPYRPWRGRCSRGASGWPRIRARPRSPARTPAIRPGRRRARPAARRAAPRSPRAGSGRRAFSTPRTSCAASSASEMRCTFSLIASFSSPNWITSRSLPSSCLAPVPQREDLPFADRDRASAVRVRDVDLRQRLGVVLEKLGVLLEIAGDFFGFHRSPVEHAVASWKLQVSTSNLDLQTRNFTARSPLRTPLPRGPSS